MRINVSLFVNPLEFNNPASSGDQQNYVIYVRLTWPPLEAALSVLTFLLKNIFEKKLIKAEEIFPPIPNHKLSKNCLDKNLSIVQ
jgi:hypothetical protein